MIDFEKQMKNDLEVVFNKVLKDCNYILDISSKSRSGAEISDYLEDKFVEHFQHNAHPNISGADSAPKGSTKNPYDIIFNYTYLNPTTGEEINDLIWGDIKATKASYADSNPDLGTPTKMINFMLDGHFHMVFILFEYESTEDNKTRFIPYENGSYTKIMLLKDINNSVRINPKPQFQVNIKAEEEYRTKMEFIDLFEQKYKESIERNIKIQNKKKRDLEGLFNKIREIHK